MLTSANTTRGAQTFINAPNNTAFGKAYLNNMDRNSFSSDLKKITIEKQIASMISNGDTAIFHAHQKISEMQKYKNCKVSKRLIQFYDLLFID